MNLYDVQQQGAQFNPFQTNPYQWSNNQQIGQGHGPWAGLGLSAAYGQGFGQFGYGQQTGWGQQRQLSQQDVGEVVRQLVPLLPHIVAQSQIAPAAYGYGQQTQLGQPFAQFGRQLTQQDVNEVVRQLLPIVPQIVGALQGPQAAAIHGGLQAGQGWQQQTWWPQQQAWQQPQGSPQYLAAFQSGWGLPMQRQLSQQDTNEVVRQLIGVIPHVIGNLQSFSQQRAM